MPRRRLMSLDVVKQTSQMQRVHANAYGERQLLVERYCFYLVFSTKRDHATDGKRGNIERRTIYGKLGLQN